MASDNTNEPLTWRGWLWRGTWVMILIASLLGSFEQLGGSGGGNS